MTISINYTAAKIPYAGQTEFVFNFELLGLQALEVWAETETETAGIFDRQLLSPQSYSVALNGGSPTYVGGTVTLTVPVASTVDQISIERNTLISQTADLKNFGPFKMPTLEMMLDKLIMIIQELGYRKCGTGDFSGAIQPFYFDEYTVLSAPVIDQALGQIAFYILLLVSAGEDCRTNPEGA